MIKESKADSEAVIYEDTAILSVKRTQIPLLQKNTAILPWFQQNKGS
ncbi:hypothetical protein IMZ08_13600 [Bacillus luteolus]|uniref:Uncharacterized protein n=1 Tax=Litchfieldia luteola TaxID=682179 RepID=A0ABR9QKR2_9BACI|nr:hypothetical protein [Cytobacillus luteolus]